MLAHRKNIRPYESIRYIASYEELVQAEQEYQFDYYFISAQFEWMLNSLPKERVLVLEDDEFYLTENGKKYRTISRNHSYYACYFVYV